MQINLTDNTRYYVNTSSSEVYDYKYKRSSYYYQNGDTKKYIKDSIYSALKRLPFNPIHTDNLDGVNFINKKENGDNLVLEIVNKNGEVYLQTENMVGEFHFKAGKSLISINIGLRFDKSDDNRFFEYLLNYAGAIYPHKVSFGTNNSTKKKSNDISKILLSNLFTHSISKAFVMGLPTIYQEINETDYNLRGKIDINKMISQELPFKGKSPYVRNERLVVSSIAIMLLKAIDKIQNKVATNFPNLSHIKSAIKQLNIPSVINTQIIKEAMNHKVLNHPSFNEYRNTLYLANLILKGFNTPKIDDINGVFYGYLVDISKIWENFLVKFIQQNIGDEWTILVEPELRLFQKEKAPLFLNRPKNVMLPDIVILHENEKRIMVFDAKFKSSQYFSREDYYKTATYITYYKNKGFEVVLSGQIYPDKQLSEINKNIGFLDSDIDFRFFGINLCKEVIPYKILDRKKECKFINILQDIVGD